MATRTSTAGTREIEGRDSVGLYLDEIARNPLLDAQTEVELSKTIEAGLMAEHLLATDRVGRRKGGAPGYATREELEWLAAEGQRRREGQVHHLHAGERGRRGLRQDGHSDLRPQGLPPSAHRGRVTRFTTLFTNRMALPRAERSNRRRR